MDRSGADSLTRRRLLQSGAAAAAVLALPVLPEVADAAATLSSAHRRTLRALLEAELPAGVPRAQISAGRAAVEARYAAASSSSRAQIGRILDTLEGAPGGLGFSALTREQRRTLLQQLHADPDARTVDFGSDTLFASFVEAETALVKAAAIGGSGAPDFASLPAGVAPVAKTWSALKAQIQAVQRADARSAVLLVQAALNDLAALDEFP